MKTHLALLTIAHTALALAQGPLTPPPGSDPNIGPANALTPGGLPQATMKTLHQVEPRTAIAGGTSTVTINQSGSYYLTGNIVVAGGDGISIQSSNVTLDLNGFSVSSSAGPAAGTGITLGSVVNITIRHGNIGGGFAGGVRSVQTGGPPQQQFNVRIADLSISYVTEAGIGVSEAQVERCLVLCSNVNALGIGAWSVKDSRVRGGSLNGIVVKDCFVDNSSTTGITAQVVENSVAISSGNAINAKCLINSYATGGGNHDVVSAGVAQNVWAEGGGGTGDGIEAMIVGNSYGKRESDLNGFATGAGIRASADGVVTASGGRGLNGIINASVVADSSGNTNNQSAPAGYGISGANRSVITGSLGIGTNHPSLVFGIAGSLGQGSVGWGGTSQTGVSTVLKFDAN